MVKAYLKYVQHDVMGGLVSNTSNMAECKIMKNGVENGQYLLTGCNEVVNFTNLATQEIEYKIYDHEAQFGYVTYISVSANLLAIGYSSGTILVFNLDIDQALPDPDNQDHLLFEQVH